MKKLLIVAGAVLLLSLGLVGLASADNGPHGGYTATTDACAGCHRAHTAQGARLLVSGSDSNESFCKNCHNGSGAYTNVFDGILDYNITATTAVSQHTNVPGTTPFAIPLRGGGFDFTLMKTDPEGSDPSTGQDVTSKHSVDGTSVTAWGYVSTTNPLTYGAPNVKLTCTNCHGPHGKSGADSTPTYRILRGMKSGGAKLGYSIDYLSGITETMRSITDVTDVADANGNRVYTTTQMYFGADDTYGPNPAQIATWCSGCHTRYLANKAASKTALGGSAGLSDTVFTYRHVSDASEIKGGMELSCLACHVAHGSSATMGSYSSVLKTPDPGVTIDETKNSKLLRLNNRGVCQQCHLK